MTDSHRGLPFPRRTVAIIALSTGAMLLMIDGPIVAVVLPTIAKELNVESASAVLIVTVYQLILAMTMLPFAALGNRIGHRRLYQAGLILHSVAAILCFFAHSLLALIIARSLQAFGAAAAMSIAIGLLRGIYPLERLGTGLGINTIANAIGAALAPVIGGFIISIADWHWVFVAVVPLSIITLLLSRALPEPEPRQHRFDLLGAGLCALTFGLLVSGLESTIHSSHLFLSIGIFVCGAVVARFFMRHEKREADPVLPVDLLAMPVIALSIISGFAAIIANTTVALSMPFRLQHGYGFSPAEVGGIMAAYALVISAISPIAAFLSDRISVALLSTVGMVIASIALMFLAFLPEHPSHFDIVWRLWLCGIGFSLFFSPNWRYVVVAAPVKRSVAAGSLYTTMRMLAYTGAATLVAALLAFGLGEGSAPALVASFLSMVAAAISAWGLFRPKN